jgi:hypothetical protein
LLPFPTSIPHPWGYLNNDNTSCIPESSRSTTPLLRRQMAPLNASQVHLHHSESLTDNCTAHAKPFSDVTRPKAHACSRSSPCLSCNRCIPARKSGAERRTGRHASGPMWHGGMDHVLHLGTGALARSDLHRALSYQRN